MPELRTPVMILVEVSWQEQGGVQQKSRACMEDKSAGGARIRVKTPIAAGSHLRIQWRFEQFAGIAKYCRREGREYVVGVQRQEASDSTNDHGRERIASGEIARGEARPQENETTLRSLVAGEILEGQDRVETSLLLQSMSLMQLPVPQPFRRETARDEFARRQISRRPLSARDRPRKSRREELAVSGEDERGGKEISAQEVVDRERKPMARKWLGLAPWHNKQDDAAASGKDASEKENSMTEEAPNHDESRRSASAKENRMPLSQSAPSTEKIATLSAREVPAFQVELLPMEDIYRTAGIVSPRKGYSVTKVVEMLNSEHIRGLSKETKRAALLMALDAAGVTIEQVQRDAKSRQSALDSYETEQKKQAEAEWARKAEEITHIQAELESIKAHYTARISRNMEALARDKARFNSWVTTKEQESQSMAEAVELCLKLPRSEPAASREREVSVAAAGSVAAAAGAGKAM
jgi:hypothetical protein